jgi:hypothetical protein
MLPDSLSLTLMFLLPSSLAGAGIVKYIPSPADDVIGALCLLGLFDLILFQTFQKIQDVFGDPVFMVGEPQGGLDTTGPVIAPATSEISTWGICPRCR